MSKQENKACELKVTSAVQTVNLYFLHVTTQFTYTANFDVRDTLISSE